MKLRWSHAVCYAAVFAAAAAHAQPAGTYKCVDQAGRSTYTNVKEEMTGRNCSLVSREVSVVPNPNPPAAAKPPAAAPSNPAARASDRRKILEEELNGEEKRLADARGKLAEQQSVRGGDERNFQRVIDRLKPFVDAVEQHEKNIAQLRKELSSVR